MDCLRQRLATSPGSTPLLYSTFLIHFRSYNEQFMVEEYFRWGGCSSATLQCRAMQAPSGSWHRPGPPPNQHLLQYRLALASSCSHLCSTLHHLMTQDCIDAGRNGLLDRCLEPRLPRLRHSVPGVHPVHGWHYHPPLRQRKPLRTLVGLCVELGRAAATSAKLLPCAISAWPLLAGDRQQNLPAPAPAPAAGRCVLAKCCAWILTARSLQPSAAGHGRCTTTRCPAARRARRSTTAAASGRCLQTCVPPAPLLIAQMLFVESPLH